LALSVALLAMLAGCGGGSGVRLPSGVVARVGEISIARGPLDHWVAVGDGSLSRSRRGIVFDPPSFRRCAGQVAAKLPRARVVTVAGGMAGLCERSYQRFEQSAMQMLISAAWIEQEARSMHINVSDVAVRQRLAALMGQTPAARRRFVQWLASSGMSVSDELWRLRVQMLFAAVRSRVVASAGHVTVGQELAYFRSHLAQFARSASRDVRVLVVGSRGDGEAALGELRGGGGFGAVASRYQDSGAYAPPGGLLAGVVRGTHGSAFDGPVFSAPVGRWGGPVLTPGGWYVFQVVAVRAAQPASFARVRSRIHGLLLSQSRAWVWSRFAARFERDWRSRTRCASGLTGTQCSNGPAGATR
jgi:parvulin-like peptidyl-prolyl isomerase